MMAGEGIGELAPVLVKGAGEGLTSQFVRYLVLEPGLTLFSFFLNFF